MRKHSRKAQPPKVVQRLMAKNMCGHSFSVHVAQVPRGLKEFHYKPEWPDEMKIPKNHLVRCYECNKIVPSNLTNATQKVYWPK